MEKKLKLSKQRKDILLRLIGDSDFSLRALSSSYSEQDDKAFQDDFAGHSIEQARIAMKALIQFLAS